MYQKVKRRRRSEEKMGNRIRGLAISGMVDFGRLWNIAGQKEFCERGGGR
jgi:hypothetical protein